MIHYHDDDDDADDADNVDNDDTDDDIDTHGALLADDANAVSQIFA